MASRKQIAANRANSKRSTGPKTKEGKARSRLNSWRHGLTAEDIVIYNEDPRAFDALRAELFEQIDPAPGIESMLSDRLASLEWRLRRIPLLEAAALDTQCFNLDDKAVRQEAYLKALAAASANGANADGTSESESEPLDSSQDDESEDERRSQYLGQVVIDDDMLIKLSNYEARLLATYEKTWEILLRIQSARRRSEEQRRTIDGAATDAGNADRSHLRLLSIPRSARGKTSK